MISPTPPPPIMYRSRRPTNDPGPGPIDLVERPPTVHRSHCPACMIAGAISGACVAATIALIIGGFL